MAEPTMPCPACGPGHCTPSCPEKSWRYAEPSELATPFVNVGRRGVPCWLPAALVQKLTDAGLRIVSDADGKVLDACKVAGLGMTARGELTIASGERVLAAAISDQRGDHG